MGIADFVGEQVGTLLDFGRVAATSVLSAAKTVAATIVGDEDPDGDEKLDASELWGPAPLLYRPQDPDDDGACEALFIRYGDERVVVATKDRRFQVEPAEGEVRVVALGADGDRQAQVILQADGTAIVQAVEVRIGSSDAAETIGLGTAIKNHFSSIKSYIDAHTHGPGTFVTAVGSGGGGGAVTGSSGAPSSASPSVPDVESRHKVED